MSLDNIRQRAALGVSFLNATQRAIAFEHGWIQGWCSLCHKEMKPGTRYHLRDVHPRKQVCLGKLTFVQP